MAILFGTDGVRGVANRELTPELAFKLGRAGAAVLALESGHKRPKVLIGRDTRASGEMLEAALAAGVTSVGADVVRLGILPTPGVAYLTQKLDADAGIMISASHNPVEDNGIKFFSRDGFKLGDEVESQIESIVLGETGSPILSTETSMMREDLRPVAGGIGRIYDRFESAGDYASFLKSAVDTDCSGLKVVLDCGNGAAYDIAPKVLSELGAEVYVINASPNGVNINVDCGSTHPDVVRKAVLEQRADVGLSHDGDADRLIAVDETGGIIDGDHILAICGLDMLERGMLPKKTIVATIYSNLGLKMAFERAGGHVIFAKAGDRYVLEDMRKHGIILGGEKSGHLIFLEHNTTGDGILTALKLIAIMKKSGKPLSELGSVLQEVPQLLVNVRVQRKEALESNQEIGEAIRRAESLLGDEGRIFVRASGTEPLVRVLGEGSDEALVKQVVEEVVSVVDRELND